MIDKQRVVRLLLDGARNPLSMLPAKHEGPQDQEIECPLQQGDAGVGVLLGRHTTGVSTRSGRMSTRLVSTLSLPHKKLR
jgi:hypothetical protein